MNLPDLPLNQHDIDTFRKRMVSNDSVESEFDDYDLLRLIKQAEACIAYKEAGEEMAKALELFPSAVSEAGSDDGWVPIEEREKYNNANQAALAKWNAKEGE